METNMQGITPGTPVFAADGVRVGRVMNAYEGGIDVEKGRLFLKDFHVSYAQVDRVERHAIHLLVNVDQLIETIGGLPVRRHERALGHAQAGVDPLTDARMTHR